MGRALNRLKVVDAKNKTDPGRYADGGGLYLDVTARGTKSWVFMYRSPVHRLAGSEKSIGRTREMGLGAFGIGEKDRISLAQARELAEDARRLIKAGRDPLDERGASRAKAAKIPTFGEMADQYIEAMEGQWRNEKHRAQWRMTLEHYAETLRPLPVNEITVDHVLAVLKPLWKVVPETAGRLRGRIERVLNAAKASGYRNGENPAAWRGHLDNLLQARPPLTRGHHAALPYEDIPSFVASLRQRSGVAALALEFLVLTAARSGEVRGAVRDEFDLDRRVWIIPAQRMKAGRKHRVPLVARAVEIVEIMLRLDVSPFAFPGARPGSPLSDMSLTAVLRRMGVEFTVHGFRSSFKDWAYAETNFPNELSEAALAHVTGDKTEQAYKRSDALERRRELMKAWSSFCDAHRAANVVQLRAAR